MENKCEPWMTFYLSKPGHVNFIAPVQSEPIEDIEIIPENEVPKGSPD